MWAHRQARHFVPSYPEIYCLGALLLSLGGRFLLVLIGKHGSCSEPAGNAFRSCTLLLAKAVGRQVLPGADTLSLMRPCLLVNVCLLLVWCTVACALSRCRPLPGYLALPPLLPPLRGCRGQSPGMVSDLLFYPLD
jgi:hypothetical protein